MESENSKSDFGIVPKGFQPAIEHDGTILIQYRFSGMFLMTAFLVFWFVFWTIGGYWAFQQPQSDFMTIWLVMWTFGEVAVGYSLLWMFFGRTTLKFDEAVLTVEKKLVIYRRHVEIPKNDIKEIQQVQDGGEGEDSFPSWGLKIVARKTHFLLRRQEYLKSVWLGNIIGKWSGLRFKPVPKS